MVGGEAGEALKQTFSILGMREVWHSPYVSWVWQGKGERGRKIRHRIGRCCYLPNHCPPPVAKRALFWRQPRQTIVSERWELKARVIPTVFLVRPTLRIGGSSCSDSLSSIIVRCGCGGSTLAWLWRRGCAEERRRLGWRERGVNVDH